MRTHVGAVIGLVLMSAGLANGEIRTWTSGGGQHTIEAEFAGLKDGVVTLRNATGKTRDIPLDQLSTADQKLAEKLAAAGDAKPTEEESIAAIKKLGGGFVGRGALYFSGPKVTDDALVHLKGLTGLRVLVVGPNVTDAGLVHFKGVPGLTHLTLFGAKVTDAGLVHLKGLTGLTELNLEKTLVTGAGVAKLKVALPKCQILH